MPKSPGHRKWPDHEVREEPVAGRVRAEVDGEVVAETGDAIRVVEDEHPDRYYFPRPDVRMERLEPSDTTTRCPFKGEASYFHVRSDGGVLRNAAWSYEAPYDEHAGLKGRIAFYEERAPGLTVRGP